ncbi:MAG: Dihydrolipoyllysine-residue acetyltransferase component of pyruvate dehydrogenase complex [Chlamydiae bacterium]|nr:Dihydrolipoyllysine-residue acetyltransferase component of pyruvate dehydrogenase complex [Chlamydiota bacterium]
MEHGIIAKWHKKVGEKVEAGEVLLEITTDKATVEHNALDEGFLKAILISEGAQANVNQAIAIFTEEESESIEGYQPEGQTPAGDQEEAKEQPPANQQAEDSPQKESPKGASFSQPAFVPEPPLDNYSFPYHVDAGSSKIAASPLAKKIAKEKNLDLSSIKGSGPGGRVMSEDLDLAQHKSLASFSNGQTPTIAPGTYDEEAMSPVQTIVAERLQAAKTFIPHFYINQDIEVSAMMRVRLELKKQNIKVSFNDFVVRACALALKEHPKINSGFNSQNKTVIRFKTIDIAIAVSLEEGLITPIIRYADYKNLGQLSQEVKNLAKKARDGKLAMEEFKGGSFTISNLGMYGISSLLPVINPPQAAILGVGGISTFPKVENGELIEGNKMTLTLAADHRAINGEDGAKFLKTLKGLLENPSVLLI